MRARAHHWRRHLENVGCLRRLYHQRVCLVSTKMLPDASTILLDIPRTFPRHPWFTKERRHTLEQQLMRYAAVFRGDGYIQGFSFIMAVALYVFESEGGSESLSDSWWVGVEVIHRIRPVMPDFNMKWFDYTRTQYVDKLKRVMKKYRRNLWNLIEPHMHTISHVIMMRWIMIWFSKNFPLEDVVIIWDALFLCDHHRLMDLYVSISVAILSQAAPKLFEVPSSNIPHTITDYMAERPEEIITVARAFM